ncbi:iron-containing alcohol dehydrogenase [Microbacterium sp. A93]|uniref:iron-containing alcohol dehydrogenase n=1 Tax=Microbacterium sp. A93 TaxID=3450716 RepID=UPI003F440D2C
MVYREEGTFMKGVMPKEAEPSSSTGEIYSFAPMERIRWGEPASLATRDEVERLGAKRVLIVSSATLSRETDVIDELRATLGDRVVGVFDRCVAHTPLESVEELLAEARSLVPNLFVTVGGGTPIDTVKLTQFALGRGLRTRDEILAERGVGSSQRSSIRQIVVPTTLSGSEYTNVGGATDTVRKVKDSYPGSDLCAQTVLLDPLLTVHTPEWLWLSTGIRAMDHAVESYLSTSPNPYVDIPALGSLSSLSSALRRTRNQPGDLEARLTALQSVALATAGLGRVPLGASHGISYVLGAVADVPHGYTSCVLLPAVLQWNESVTTLRQQNISDALGAPDQSAADAMRGLIAGLGLPTTLREIGIERTEFRKIAERSLDNPLVQANPRTISDVRDLETILEYAY